MPTNPDNLVLSESPHSVKDTLDRIEKILVEKGIIIFARIDHAQAAQQAGLQMRDEELLIFGNPKAGTLLMQENAAIGIELPVKILAWKDGQGATQVGYTDLASIAQHYGITKNTKIVENVGNLLQGVVAAVTAAD